MGEPPFCAPHTGGSPSPAANPIFPSLHNPLSLIKSLENQTPTFRERGHIQSTVPNICFRGNWLRVAICQWLEDNEQNSHLCCSHPKLQIRTGAVAVGWQLLSAHKTALPATPQHCCPSTLSLSNVFLNSGCTQTLKILKCHIFKYQLSQ